MVKISSTLMKQLNKSPKRHKYGAIRTKCLHGHDHDSRKEADWCIKIHQEQREGKIRNLLMQTTYDLRVNGIVVCKHILDFDYERLNGKIWYPEVVDVKGVKLPLWSLKHKLFCAIFTGIKYVVV